MQMWKCSIKQKSLFSNLPSSPFDCFENIVPDFFPSWSLVLFELAFFVAFSNLPDESVENIVNMAPVKKQSSPLQLEDKE